MTDCDKSIAPCEELYQNRIYVTGTLKWNSSGNPPEVTCKKLAKGEAVVKYNSPGIAIVKWRDKKEVLFIFTEFKGQMMKARVKQNDTRTPKPILKYNEIMAAADWQNEMLAYYMSEKRTGRWYKKIGNHIISIMLLNGYYLYNKYSTKKKKISYDDYRHNIKKILLSQVERRIAERPETDSANPVRHLPERTPVTENGGQLRRQCKVCYKKKQNHKFIPFYCPSCPEKPAICPGKCFTTCYKHVKT
ncbi:piggyBac transposable element-derived protein 4-like [Neodiprion pinetum]|uniref:piggyBac transposable element-derived protein 4-like n=1 Tax=Neodiprion pinetum TaxID=441929 RepID=UPI001EE0F17B|nr:uncharacterized protein LOC124220001 [Neodiprion pinetum]